MPGGVVFLIVVPTANFERELVYGNELSNLPSGGGASTSGPDAGVGVSSVTAPENNLNINLPENNKVLRLEVELLEKNAPKYRRGGRGGRGGRHLGPVNAVSCGQARNKVPDDKDNLSMMVPMEKVLEELLSKLEIEHVTWSLGKKGYYYHIVFPLPSGEPCETTLHCLTELGIGTKSNSSISVLPCSVSYDALMNPWSGGSEDSEGTEEDIFKWNTFVDSIKSKLTVKQVVDGVRAGGSLSFDYLLLIVTADSLAALGLVENNAPNIVAAMLVSPLMGPVMSITFGTIISDRELMKVGFISLGLGMFISCLFGFIFGLILGTTEMPWGFGDWPTDEMRGRGNVRSLWMGVLWALTSGTGVAVALLQGSAGPLIGVAISASLLPPVVNCGLFWALACIWQIYPDIKMPHLKGESYTGNSSYEYVYTNYLPTEFLIHGIVSGLLTVVNVICIFITAIVVLKIKEISAPYTASPDLKRFWDTDLRTARKFNRSTVRQRRGTFRDKLLYDSMQEPRNKKLDTVLEQALKETADDVTFKKVKRMSYSNNAAEELTQRLANAGGLSSASIGHPSTIPTDVRNSKSKVDLQALDKLISSLLEQHHQHYEQPPAAGTPAEGSPAKLNRFRPLSRSANNIIYSQSTGIGHDYESQNNLNMGTINNGSSANNGVQHSSPMPTILEQNQNPVESSWSSLKSNTATDVRNVFNTIANAPHRFSQSLGTSQGDENAKLTQNIME